jgi:hypothetical protein
VLKPESLPFTTTASPASGTLEGPRAVAHRSLPFGTMIRVTNQRTGKSGGAAVLIVDPTPRVAFSDLRPSAAERRALNGLGEVPIRVVGRAER